MFTQVQLEAILHRLEIPALNAMQQAAQATITAQAGTVLLSPTGSGKTLAFLLPVASFLRADIKTVQCLILTPSRELALQIEQVWKKMSTGFKVACCYGGHDMQTEIQNMAEPPTLLIGTPGRIKDHMERNSFTSKDISTIVLDEFDKSLELGFDEEMQFIMGELQQLQKRILVSATKALVIPDFTGLVQPEVLDYITIQEEPPALEIKLVASAEKDKIDALYQLLCFIQTGSVIIFCNHREAVERTTTLLQQKGIDAGCFHGGLEQMQREQALVKLRNGTTQFLVATDLAARGLDIPEVKHIIHYHLPHTAAEFTHRNGRTARMQATGTAYLLMHDTETIPAYVAAIATTLQLPIKVKPPLPTVWTTLFINGGKKEKLNKTDIVGFFTQKGKLDKADIGLIEVKDFVCFTAVKKQKVKELLLRIQNEKMKGKKYIVKIAR
ncbi:DEAD/DEAH box helicase [Limnovirga soli]|uniref:DEAD/DEAH box helicase n=1 Tax=Limnovirga soli TaxID=2656915 RepID=A0A8J8FGG6_9BACT|nr:DEAD/DEAH box helicase [Limnovirga soli]NNV55411.1 DEAD/DEAH box helicase [Limnovirga soli]